MRRDLLTGQFVGESPHSGASYYARDGRVYAKTADGEQIAATALSANGRELEQHDRALQAARHQREHGDPNSMSLRPFPGETAEDAVARVERNAKRSS